MMTEKGVLCTFLAALNFEKNTYLKASPAKQMNS